MTPQEPGVCAVTGASGYVGSIITQELRKHMPVVQITRNPKTDAEIAWSLESDKDIAPTLRSRNVKTLVHAAWDMRATGFRKMEASCVRGSAALFEAAQRAGVERIVFISTISAFEGCRSSYGKSKLSVEKLLRGSPNVVFRLGLVHGEQHGGVFGGIRSQVQTSSILPIIGRGLAPQYLLHQKTLADAIVSAVCGGFDHTRGMPITLAHPKPWPFRDLVQSIADSEGRKVTLIPVPWRLLFAGFRMGEAVGLDLPFRSDSVISFVYYDRNPDFSLMRSLGIEPLPFEPG
jgi:nucleoside-diphosphate-sugar epimerase